MFNFAMKHSAAICLNLSSSGADHVASLTSHVSAQENLRRTLPYSISTPPIHLQTSRSQCWKQRGQQDLNSPRSVTDVPFRCGAHVVDRMHSTLQRLCYCREHIYFKVRNAYDAPH